MTQETKKPKRRWLRFSLRTLLIVLTIFCVWLGWYLYRVERQRAAVEWVEENGGEIMYDYKRGWHPPLYHRQIHPRNWMDRILGIDYFANVVGVSFSDTKLKQTGITKNEWTEPTGTQINDLTPLSGLSNLEELSLSGIPVKDLKPLSSLKKLRSLQLFDCQVRDLSPLTDLTNLQVLELMGNPIDDLTPLIGLTNLHTLEISYTDVTDLTPLSGLKNLNTLWFCDTEVEDVSPLEGLTSLSSLRAVRTNVSCEDALKFQQAHPDCIVLHFKPRD